ncbi:PH domain-containing protein [Tistlia consotensis]|uniref:PH domain-containing protein n=1 Tax=Tistlia consotensis USBA 355 TaxID=560819 RepID=A0A1Y6BGY4_9PROT|nr:PH domain-containing protein [Tistlia consotensis]SMF09352.1 PH domain-containing protein [Tistlia consotensis USBA 355]SNR34621.1 PH domain-containing protein [Tistlia consotensis]
MTEAATVFYRYPPNRLVGDYLRAGVGVAFGLAILLASDKVTWVMGLIFGGLALAFGLFGLRTLRQHMTEVAVNEDGIFTRTPTATRTLAWSELEGLRLRYFGSHRQRKSKNGGFLELTLYGPAKRMRFESSISGFRDIAWWSSRAARHNGVSLDPATAGNFLAIGIDADGETPRPLADPDFEL